MKVMIRMFKGEPIALFPYEVTGQNTIMSYAHIGQHSDAVWDLHRFTKPCPEPLAQELIKELRAIGYNSLNVIRRRNHAEYLSNFYKSLLK